MSRIPIVFGLFFSFAAVAGNSDTIKVIDNAIFKDKKKSEQQAEEVTTSAKGNVRYRNQDQKKVGRAQRNGWLKDCQGKRKNSKEFKKCFADRAAEDGAILAEQQKSVEDGQNKPAQNVRKLYPDDSFRDPSSED